MNCETCDRLLQQLKSINTLAISIAESEQLDKEMSSRLYDILTFTAEMEQPVVFEAIKAHMQRYLHIYETLKNNPQMTENDKGNGYAELGAELSDLKDLMVKF